MKRFAARRGTIADAGDTLREEALPASLLLLTVVYPGAAVLGRTRVDLRLAGGVACLAELPLTDFNSSSFTHP